MIDYENLKLAHELAEKLTGNGIRTDVYVSFYQDNKPVFGFRYDNNLFESMNINEIKVKLQELTKIKTKTKPKYEIFQKVWRVNDEDKPHSFVISDYINDSEPMYLENDLIEYNMWWLEEQLYPTREALIEAQIDYWNNLKLLTEISNALCKCGNPLDKGRSVCDKCIQRAVDSQNHKPKKECDHESDGIDYLTNPPKTKCNKCGEFY